MSTAALIAHHTPGRVRLEVPSRRGDQAFFAALSERVASGNGARRVRANPLTASVVVEYAGAFDAVLGALRDAELSVAGKGAEGAQARPTPMASFVSVMQAFKRQPHDGQQAADPLLLAGAAFGLIGLVQTARGEIMLPALSAFWYAVSALRLASLPPAADMQQMIDRSAYHPAGSAQRPH